MGRAGDVRLRTGSEADLQVAQNPERVEDLDECGNRQERSEGQWHLRPLAGFSAHDQHEKPDKRSSGSGEHRDNKAFHGTANAEPCSEHGHELGVSQAHAFLASNDPIGQADEQDQSAGCEDGEHAVPRDMEQIAGQECVGAGPCLLQSKENSESDAGVGEQVREPEILGVKSGQRCEQPTEKAVADDGDQAVDQETRCQGFGGICSPQGRAEVKPTSCPEHGNDYFGEGVAPGDRDVAGAAAAAQQNPTEEREILPPGQGVIAVAAVGARGDDALVFGKAYQHDVEKAAEGQAKQCCKDGSDALNFVHDTDSVPGIA
jgi:hypothetical protein